MPPVPVWILWALLAGFIVSNLLDRALRKQQEKLIDALSERADLLSDRLDTQCKKMELLQERTDIVSKRLDMIHNPFKVLKDDKRH